MTDTLNPVTYVSVFATRTAANIEVKWKQLTELIEQLTELYLFIMVLKQLSNS